MRIGRYETLGVIGTGGMGTVYLGRALGVGGFERQVALKVMHPHLLGDRQFVDMFLDEARLAARILHPNVVSTHDVQQLPEGLFLVMDYVPGPSLHAVLEVLRRRGQYLPTGICLAIFLDVLAGLHAAHELCDSAGKPLNIAHRDISPDNILISRDGMSRLTDFGLARAQAQIGTTRGGQLKGKLSFLAPETILFAQVDRRSDVYAAGATLWEALTLRRLYRADTEGMLLALILEGAVRDPSYENPAVPKPIAEVCMQALQKNPEVRFQSADELSEALRHAAKEASVEIAPASEIAQWLAPIIDSEQMLTLVPERPSTRPFPGLAEDQIPSQAGTVVTSPGKPRGRAPLLAAVTATVLAGVGVGAYLASAGSRAPASPPVAASARPDSAAVAAPAPPSGSSQTAPPPSAAASQSGTALSPAATAPRPAPAGAPPARPKPAPGRGRYDPDDL